MSLRAASWLGRYRLLQDFAGGANCRWTFAERDGREFFIKEFQRPKYPPEDLAEPGRTLRLARCRAFEERHQRLLAAIRKAADATDALAAPIDSFRHEFSYYDVTPRIALASKPAPALGSLSSARARLANIRSVARGILALHAENVVHGDLKPSNILFGGMAGEMPATWLIDFDAAYFADQPPPPDEMEFDQTYMAPEVLAHVRRLSNAVPPGLAADVFSLGLLIHEYWTGRAPSTAGPYRYPAEAVLAGEGLTLSTHDIDPAIEQMMRRALGADPAQRPLVWEIDAAAGAAHRRLVGTSPLPEGSASDFAETSDNHGQQPSASARRFSEQQQAFQPLMRSLSSVPVRKSRNLDPSGS